MLTGQELGAAIESARMAKGVSKKKLAEDFGAGSVASILAELICKVAESEAQKASDKSL